MGETLLSFPANGGECKVMSQIEVDILVIVLALFFHYDTKEQLKKLREDMRSDLKHLIELHEIRTK